MKIIKLITDVDTDEWAPDDSEDDTEQMQVNRYELKYKLYM